MSFDIIVVGAGPAGSGAAAALARLGKSVLWLDAGQARHRQLAGELLHPPGVEDVQRLGLEAALARVPHATIEGFAVVDGEGGAKRTALLSYPPGETGVAAEHGALVDALAQVARQTPGIDFWATSRVTAIAQTPTGVELRVAVADEVRTVRAEALVAADGRGSTVRRLLGLREAHRRLSTMLGLTVPASSLPHPARGHIFIGGPSPVLAYDIGGGTARVMVDLPLGSTVKTLAEDPSPLIGLPLALRAAVLNALATQTPRMASNDERIPERVACGRVAFLGDAAGCCHPISASGIASSLRDARELEEAVASSSDNLSRAFARYSQRRRPAQRTRIALASALFQAFSDPGDGMAALRTGLFTYWLATPRGVQRSMALLSTRDGRMGSMAREYCRVAGHGLWHLLKTMLVKNPHRLRTLARGSRELFTSMAGHLRGAARGAAEDLLRRG